MAAHAVGSGRLLPPGPHFGWFCGAACLPPFEHQLQLGRDGSARGSSASWPAAVRHMRCAAACYKQRLPLPSLLVFHPTRTCSPVPAPPGFWKRYGLLCAHEQIMAKIKPHQVGSGLGRSALSAPACRWCPGRSGFGAVQVVPWLRHVVHAAVSHYAIAALPCPALQMVEVFMPQYLPMLIPPVPWLRNNMGGHLTLRNTGACTCARRRWRQALQGSVTLCMHTSMPPASRPQPALISPAHPSHRLPQ